MIRLLVSDIDGTLLTQDKQLTEATKDAAARLARSGCALALTSSRPPHGIEVFARALSLQTPRAAFNGAVITAPDGSVVSAHFLDAALVRDVTDRLAQSAIPPWLFTPDEWLLLDPDGDYVSWEAHTVKMPFRQVASFAAHAHQAGKIMAASKDTARLGRIEEELAARLDGRASVHRSQAYYLDITHPEGTKGHAVRAIAALLGIELRHVAVIGDMANDLPMFEVAPLSIAMGQAPDAVRQRATHVTTGNNADGWAHAIDNFILPRTGD